MQKPYLPIYINSGISALIYISCTVDPDFVLPTDGGMDTRTKVFQEVHADLKKEVRLVDVPAQNSAHPPT